MNNKVEQDSVLKVVNLSACLSALSVVRHISYFRQRIFDKRYYGVSPVKGVDVGNIVTVYGKKQCNKDRTLGEKNFHSENSIANDCKLVKPILDVGNEGWQDLK